MKTWLLFAAAIASPLFAQDKAPTLALGQYLEQVKTQNPQAKAFAQMVATAELSLDKADIPFSPELYAEYNIFDQRAEPVNPFMGLETKGRNWKAGVKKQTTFGLNADAYFKSTRTTIDGLNPQFQVPGDIEQSAFGLTLTQNLLRDSFGKATRAKLAADTAAARKDLLKQKWALKQLLLEAENTYWSLASYDQIIKRQEENVERAKRLRDYMAHRASLRLFDDVDAMQSEASFQQREIELQSSRDLRSTLARKLNTLRGRLSDDVESLDALPTAEFMNKAEKAKRMSREDFQMIVEDSISAERGSESAMSMIAPKLDLTGGISSNGLDLTSRESYSESLKGRHPNWNVGLVFSIPLDYSLIHNMRASYRAQKASGEALREQARFAEEREWQSLSKQKREAQGQFERATKLEELRTDLVKRERQRLMNGRSTTATSIQIEQELAQAQITRIQTQVALLTLHNALKQFEEVK